MLKHLWDVVSEVLWQTYLDDNPQVVSRLTLTGKKNVIKVVHPK